MESYSIEDALEERIKSLYEVTRLSNNSFLKPCRDWCEKFLISFMKYRYVKTPFIYELLYELSDKYNCIEMVLYNTHTLSEEMKDCIYIQVSNEFGEGLKVDGEITLHPSKYSSKIEIPQDPIECANFLRNKLYMKPIEKRTKFFNM